MRYFILILLAVFLTVEPARAQQQLVGILGMPSLEFAALDGADFDGDGDLDIFLTGMNLRGEPFTGVYRFVERRVTPVPNSRPRIDAVYERRSFISRNVMQGTVDWADFNGDGRPDVLASGLSLVEVTTTTTELQPFTDIYVGGNGTLTFNSSTGLPGVFDSRTAIADINGDGALDLILSGRTLSGLELGLFLNDNDGSVGFTQGTLPVEDIWATGIEAADLDGDGRTDIAVAGFDASNQPVLYLWRNLGNGQFASMDTGIEPKFFGSASFGDVDADGDMDMVILGAEPSARLLTGSVQLYLNDGSGGFSDVSDRLTAFSPRAPSLFYGNASVVDMDGDTDADIIMSGMTGLENDEQQSVLVYESIDEFLYLAGNARAVLNGTVRALDYDGNGMTDVFLMGRRSNSVIATIYEY